MTSEVVALPTKRPPRSSVLSLCLLLTTHLAGQQAPPQAPPFRAGVDLVQVDVSVLDKNGKPVTDLVAADFDVRERDGPQRVDTLYLVAPTAGSSSLRRRLLRHRRLRRP